MMFQSRLAYKASAGSGKTFNLVVRYLSLLFLGASPRKILALTFTNKAAAEMQERIIETLQKLEDKEELHALCEVTLLSKEQILAKKETVLEQFLNADLKIMTLDSFFSGVLRKFSLYVGLMPNFTTFASQHKQKLLNRFLDEVSVANKEETLISLALMMDKRVSDIFALLEELYIKFAQIEGLSFMPANSEVYEQAALQSLKQLKNKVFTCKEASTSVKNAVNVLDFESLLEKSWIGRDTLEYRTFKKCFEPSMDADLHAVQENAALALQAREQNFFHAIFTLFETYAKSKKALAKESAEMDFDDVTVFVHRLLSSQIQSEFLYFRLDARIEHILLDEFQDTSVLQYEILRPLIKEIISGHGVHNGGSFFFVGDVKQSIYRFRGGVSALFSFAAEENEMQVLSLDTNYRSAKAIVGFVNDIFRERMPDYKDQKPRQSAKEGFVEVCCSGDILQATASKVGDLLALGADADDIAILSATNEDGLAIESVLKQAGIAVVTEATSKLINQPVIHALIEYLKYLYFKADIYRYNFFALLQRQPCLLTKIDIDALSLIEIVKDAVKRYGLFDGEMHIFRFLKLLEKYTDIEQFLFEYERDDTPAAATQLQGVRILTVHKSKGLEYPHVIVMDRLKKAPPSRAPIIYEYEGVILQNIYLRMKGRSSVDEGYSAVLEKDKALTNEDMLNAFYVAFTRAKENLFIITKEQDSFFEALELANMRQGHLGVEQKEKIQPKPEQIFKYKPLFYGTQSDILSSEREKEENYKAINFGLGLHYYLQMMQEFTPQSAQETYHTFLNRYGAVLEEKELESIVKRVNLLIADDYFQTLVHGERFAEQGMLVEGELRYIDLLVEKEDGSYTIIDYKSSKKFHEQYLQQVHGYIKAVAAITHKSVDGYLCYLHEDGVEIEKV